MVLSTSFFLPVRQRTDLFPAAPNAQSDQWKAINIPFLLFPKERDVQSSFSCSSTYVRIFFLLRPTTRMW